MNENYVMFAAGVTGEESHAWISDVRVALVWNPTDRVARLLELARRFWIAADHHAGWSTLQPAGFLCHGVEDKREWAVDLPWVAWIRDFPLTELIRWATMIVGLLLWGGLGFEFASLMSVIRCSISLELKTLGAVANGGCWPSVDGGLDDLGVIVALKFGNFNLKVAVTIRLNLGMLVVRSQMIGDAWPPPICSRHAHYHG
ncbi:hypothetical protein ACLOJK_018825 [Asimina triloba]